MIGWLKSKHERVILIGVSLGGLITNLTSIFEKNIDGLISIFYANNLAYSVWNTLPGEYIKRDLQQKNFSYDKLNEYWSILAPDSLSA